MDSMRAWYAPRLATLPIALRALAEPQLIAELDALPADARAFSSAQRERCGALIVLLFAARGVPPTLNFPPHGALDFLSRFPLATQTFLLHSAKEQLALPQPQSATPPAAAVDAPFAACVAGIVQRDALAAQPRCSDCESPTAGSAALDSRGAARSAPSAAAQDLSADKSPAVCGDAVSAVAARGAAPGALLAAYSDSD